MKKNAAVSLKPVFLLQVLITTVLSVFLPYRIELFLGLSLLGLAGYCAVVMAENESLPRWRKCFEGGLSLLAIVAVLILLCSHEYIFYYVSVALNLILTGIWAGLELTRVSKHATKICLSIVLCTTVLFGIFGMYSHIAYGRGAMSTLAEYILRASKTTDENVPAEWQELVAAGETAWSLDESLFSKSVTAEDYNGMTVYYVNRNADYDAVVFYIHGGYYVHQAVKQQMQLMNRICEATNAMIVIPVYPLAPFHTVDDSYENMMSLYGAIREENNDKKLCLMGDSAGGGFSLALAEGMSDYGFRQPDELILLSPWVDISTTNPDISDYVDIDPMLTMAMAEYSGEAWRGEREADDWHVSPLKGDLTVLKNVTIFVGTRELFYPDIMLFYDKLESTGVQNIKLHIGQGQNHVYPVYPVLEGRIATEQIIRIVRR